MTSKQFSPEWCEAAAAEIERQRDFINTQRENLGVQDAEITRLRQKSEPRMDCIVCVQHGTTYTTGRPCHKCQQEEIERLKKRVQLQEAEVRSFISANQGFVEQAEKHKAELHDADQVIRTLVRRIELLKEEVQRRHDEPPTLTEKEIEMSERKELCAGEATNTVLVNGKQVASQKGGAFDDDFVMFITKHIQETLAATDKDVHLTQVYDQDAKSEMIVIYCRD